MYMCRMFADACMQFWKLSLSLFLVLCHLLYLVPRVSMRGDIDHIILYLFHSPRTMHALHV
jgi:hypothetical protein